MARHMASELTERELEVMHALWEGGESTIAEKLPRVSDELDE